MLKSPQKAWVSVRQSVRSEVELFVKVQFLFVVVALALGACAPARPNIRIDANGNPRQEDVAATCSAHFAQQSPQWKRCMQGVNQSVTNLARCIKTVPLPGLQRCMKQKPHPALGASLQ
ncbi:hypothetical protein GCM10007874_50560 [Labrys miyagiensis]|uniref:Uncharacterized protein n=1 Tax=Labrys miyagiensis TaxID=346912 RepID=A0ABQ6CQL3_9HYPH|nr:hypothetical protein GCM10007874_50560 [Labrys miyagiensis]